MLTLGSPFGYRIWGQRMLGAVMAPSTRFASPRRVTAAEYEDRALWLARPDISATNASLWLPVGAPRAKAGPVAIFYVHPTSYMAPFNLARWNASVQDEDSNDIASRFVMTQASAFNRVGTVWAPRYRQAHFGAFLHPSENSSKAIDAAYNDIAAAFRAFLNANPSGPIVLAGHSQGSRHLMELLKNEIAGTATADRVVAAYLIGWPVSMTEDIPALGLPACERADQAGCILSWQTFAEPADVSLVLHAYESYRGATGKTRKGTPILCVNPLTGTPESEALSRANLGSLVPIADREASAAELKAGLVGARCDDGFLFIGTPPQVGPYVLPGNNYHVYDYALFWANIRQDAEKRLATYLRQYQ